MKAPKFASASVRTAMLAAVSMSGFFFAQATRGEEIDLGAVDTNTFTPYINERHGAWTLLPLFAIAVVLLHLQRSKPRARAATAPDTATLEGALSGGLRDLNADPTRSTEASQDQTKPA